MPKSKQPTMEDFIHNNKQLYDNLKKYSNGDANALMRAMIAAREVDSIEQQHAKYANLHRINNISRDTFLSPASDLSLFTVSTIVGQGTSTLLVSATMGAGFTGLGSVKDKFFSTAKLTEQNEITKLARAYTLGVIKVWDNLYPEMAKQDSQFLAFGFYDYLQSKADEMALTPQDKLLFEQACVHVFASALANPIDQITSEQTATSTPEAPCQQPLDLTSLKQEIAGLRQGFEKQLTELGLNNQASLETQIDQLLSTMAAPLPTSWETHRYDIQASFQGATLLAMFFGNSKLAADLDAIGQTALVIGDNINLISNIATSAAQGSMFGPTVAIASAVLTLVMHFTASKQPNPHALILKAIRQLSQQVDSFRLEMHHRFDDIGKQLYQQHFQVLEQFGQLHQENQQILASLRHQHETLLQETTRIREILYQGFSDVYHKDLKTLTREISSYFRIDSDMPEKEFKKYLHQLHASLHHISSDMSTGRHKQWSDINVNEAWPENNIGLFLADYNSWLTNQSKTPHINIPNPILLLETGLCLSYLLDKNRPHLDTKKLQALKDYQQQGLAIIKFTRQLRQDKDWFTHLTTAYNESFDEIINALKDIEEAFILKKIKQPISARVYDAAQQTIQAMTPYDVPDLKQADNWADNVQDIRKLFQSSTPQAYNDTTTLIKKKDKRWGNNTFQVFSRAIYYYSQHVPNYNAYLETFTDVIQTYLAEINNLKVPLFSDEGDVTTHPLSPLVLPHDSNSPINKIPLLANELAELFSQIPKEFYIAEQLNIGRIHASFSAGTHFVLTLSFEMEREKLLILQHDLPIHWSRRSWGRDDIAPVVAEGDLNDLTFESMLAHPLSPAIGLWQFGEAFGTHLGVNHKKLAKWSSYIYSIETPLKQQVQKIASQTTSATEHPQLEYIRSRITHKRHELIQEQLQSEIIDHLNNNSRLKQALDRLHKNYMLLAMSLHFAFNHSNRIEGVSAKHLLHPDIGLVSKSAIETVLRGAIGSYPGADALADNFQPYKNQCINVVLRWLHDHCVTTDGIEHFTYTPMDNLLDTLSGINYQLTNTLPLEQTCNDSLSHQALLDRGGIMSTSTTSNDSPTSQEQTAPPESTGYFSSWFG